MISKRLNLQLRIPTSIASAVDTLRVSSALSDSATLHRPSTYGLFLKYLKAPVYLNFNMAPVPGAGALLLAGVKDIKDGVLRE